MPVKNGTASWVGMRTIIKPGVVLGEGCIIGAGAVVTKPFPSGSPIAGSPAKVVRQRDIALFERHLKENATYLRVKGIERLAKVELST